MLISLQFQTFDPYMSFSSDSPGYERGIFRDEKPAFHGSYTDRFRPIWHKGKKAYIAVAQALGKQPTKQDFKKLAIAIEELGSAIAPLVKSAVNIGYLTLIEEYNGETKSADELCSAQALEAAVAIYLHTIEEGHKVKTPYIIQTDSGKSLDLEIVFQAMAVIAVDDYLIACLLASGETSAYKELTQYLHTAETIIRAKKIAESTACVVKSEQARKGAKARAEKYYNRNGAILEWNINGSAYSSAAAFAQQRHKDFNYTDPAHLARIIRQSGKKHPKKSK